MQRDENNLTVNSKYMHSKIKTWQNLYSLLSLKYQVQWIVNYRRTISIMSHLTKVLLRVIMARMRKSLRPEISQLQFGFVPDKSTRNAIFTLSMLAERCIEMQKDLYLCFIDYSKAFDKVRHEKLFNILEHLDIDGKDLRVIRNLYWDQSAAVE